MYNTYSDTLCASVMYCSKAFWKILPTTFIPDVWIIGFVKNKGIIKRPSSLLFFCPPLIFQVLCCPCWVNNFPSFVGNWKDKHRIPWVTQSRNTHRLTWMLEHTCMEQSTHTEFWLTTMPPLLSLDSCTGAEHASCWWKIIYQSLRCHCGNLFSPNITFTGSSLFTQYCSKATEPRNCLKRLNEVPIMNVMIKRPHVR